MLHLLRRSRLTLIAVPLGLVVGLVAPGFAQTLADPATGPTPVTEPSAVPETETTPEPAVAPEPEAVVPESAVASPGTIVDSTSPYYGSSAPSSVPSSLYPGYWSAGYLYPSAPYPPAIYYTNYYVPMSSVAYPVYDYPVGYGGMSNTGVVYGAAYPFVYVNGGGGTWPPQGYQGPVQLGW